MIELHNDSLHVSFPDLHPKAHCTIEFQRTLRVPDDNQDYPLPAGLGRFPLHAVDDHAVPPRWREHGGVFLPMYQSEALWINFRQGWPRYPMAVKIAAGKINAVTGGRWVDALDDDAQDYVVVPEQPWLDGFNVTADVVRQFVAAPLGEGVTAEGQLTGEETWGGVQLIVYPMKAEAYRRRFERPALREEASTFYGSRIMYSRRASVEEMGLAAGGRIRQTIKEDPYGLDEWDTSVHSRCFVHLLNSERYREVTGRRPPPTPVTAKAYARARIPWFDYYSDGKALPGAAALAKLDGIAGALFKRGRSLEDNAPIVIAGTIGLGQRGNPIRDGVF